MSSSRVAEGGASLKLRLGARGPYTRNGSPGEEKNGADATRRFVIPFATAALSGMTDLQFVPGYSQ